MKILVAATVAAMCSGGLAALPAQAAKHGPKYYKPLSAVVTAEYSTRGEADDAFSQRSMTVRIDGQPAYVDPPHPYGMLIPFYAHGPGARATVTTHHLEVIPATGECGYWSQEETGQGQVLVDLDVSVPGIKTAIPDLKHLKRLPKGRKTRLEKDRTVSVRMEIATQIPTTITETWDESTDEGGCVRKTKVTQRGEEFKPIKFSTGGDDILRGKLSRDGRTVSLVPDTIGLGGPATGSGELTLSRNPALRW